MDVERLLAAVEALQEVADELGRFNTELVAVQPDTELAKESVATHLQMTMIGLFLVEWARAMREGNAESDDALLSALRGERKLTPQESAAWDEVCAIKQRGRH